VKKILQEYANVAKENRKRVLETFLKVEEVTLTREKTLEIIQNRHQAKLIAGKKVSEMVHQMIIEKSQFERTHLIESHKFDDLLFDAEQIDEKMI
jgi:hypothetical protein